VSQHDAVIVYTNHRHLFLALTADTYFTVLHRAEAEST